MRYTKFGLLVFGFGLLLGLVVIAAEIQSLQRAASGLMAFGIAALPIAMIADWRRAAKVAQRIPRRPAKNSTGRASAALRPRRRAAPPKR
jgi:hypothetical protein